MNRVGFDASAQSYDQVFTASVVGIYQRGEVWRYLDQLIEGHRLSRVLDLGCGTGEDATYFLQKGMQVDALDSSPQMVEKTRQKVDKMIQGPTTFKATCQSVEDWTRSEADPSSYDLVFSNFGALNLVSPDQLQHFLAKLDQKMSKGSHVVFVVIPKFCLWESAYFLFKRKWKRIFQRQSSPVMAHIEGTDIPTWYYSDRDLTRSIKTLKVMHRQPIGLFIPPSYLNRYFENKKNLLATLLRLERHFARWPLTYLASDHFLIHLRK